MATPSERRTKDSVLAQWSPPAAWVGLASLTALREVLSGVGLDVAGTGGSGFRADAIDVLIVGDGYVGISRRR